MVALRWAGVVLCTPDRRRVACVHVERRGNGLELPKGAVERGQAALPAARKHCFAQIGLSPNLTSAAPRLVQGRGVFYHCFGAAAPPWSAARGVAPVWLDVDEALATLRPDHGAVLAWALALPEMQS